MLARVNRVISPDDFRTVVRRGRRVGTEIAVYYRVRHEQSPARFGFILSRRVAGSVDRNLIRRRFRAVARELIDGGFTDNDVVVRVKPGLVVPSWSRIRADLRVAVGAET